MRNNLVALVVGTRGTGKTDYTKEVVFSSHMPKKLIVDTFDSAPWHTLVTHAHPERINNPVPVLQIENFPRWMNGLYRMFSGDVDVMLAAIQAYAVNTLLVFEDATKYIGSKLSSDMRRFILDSKQKNLDIVLIFHSLAAIPPELVRIADTLTLFKTNDGPPSKDKYPFPEIPAIMDELRRSESRYANKTILLN